MKVFIPYNPAGAKWHELRYCLRSIDKYIPNAEVTIYADNPVDWLTGVEFVQMDRYKKDVALENFWDTSYKQLYYANHHDGDYLYVYDDQLFLKSFSPDVFYNIALQKIETGDDKRRTDRHGKTINKAVELLNPFGIDVYNFETHTPRLYNTGKMRLLYETFDILNQDIPPAISTLYYNYFEESPKAILSVHQNVHRASFCLEQSDNDDGCYIAVNTGEIADACRDKYILHYNDSGLRFSPWGKQILKDYISNLFPDKSKYEK